MFKRFSLFRYSIVKRIFSMATPPINIFAYLSPTHISFKTLSLRKNMGGYIPAQGRLIWSRKRPFSKSRVLCGIKFVEPTEEIVTQLRERIQDSITRLANFRKVRSFIGYILIITMIGMTTFVVKQFGDNYQSLRESHQVTLSALQSHQSLTQSMSTELSSAKSILAETESLLLVSQAEASTLQDKVSALQSTIDQNSKQWVLGKAGYDKTINQLEGTNTTLNIELIDIKKRLNFLEGNIQSLKQGKERIALFKNRIYGVKVRLKEIRNEAHMTRIAAQKERDRIELLIGNNGFFVKNGKTVKPDFEALKAQRNIKVNVKFFE